RSEQWASLRSIHPTRKISGRGGLALDLEALVQIDADRFHQRLNLGVKKVVGAGNNLLLDDDAFLCLQLLDEPANVLMRHDAVAIAVDDQSGGRAGGEKGE